MAINNDFFKEIRGMPMSTYLKNLYDTDIEACKEKIKKMSGSELIEALDDTIQFDILHISNADWIRNKDSALYRSIVAELRKRI